VTTNENSGLQTVNFERYHAGPANEKQQTVTITATSSNPSVLPQPDGDLQQPGCDGTLTFTHG